MPLAWWSCQPSNNVSNSQNGISEQVIITTDSLILLKNNQLQVTINQYGGHFTGLELQSNPINPLTWGLSEEQMPANNQKGAPFQGHFLCLGRWGGPSEGEIAAGIPHNGEQSNSLWRIESLEDIEVQMKNDAPLDGLSVWRTVRLLDQQPAFLVKEVFANTHSLGRVSNVVQHVTIGPPFLSSETLFNTNAKKGFNQKFSYPDPHAYAYEWPFAIIDTTDNQTNDLRNNQVPDNFVSTHLFDPTDKYGWVSAYDPKSGNLLAYVWKLSEYPWINIWSHFENGKAHAKGLEFGTTGIGRPYASLLETDTRFHGINSWEYLDAGEEKEKTYLGLMINLGKGQANPSLSITDTEISLNDKKILDNPL
jgi:hypothetical protein